MARPSTFNEEVTAQICLRVASGRSLRSVCKDADMPSMSTVFRWLEDDSKAKFREQYARSRSTMLEHMAEEILEIADDGTNDFVKEDHDDGVVVERFDHEHVQRSRLRVDSRKWLLSKLVPKVYGDRIENRITDGDGKPMAVVLCSVLDPKPVKE